MTDHDQLFKSLLMEFPEEFFELFFPEWVPLFDFSRVEWLHQEVFPDPPDGERRAIDLVAKLPRRERPDDPAPEGPREWLALIHIEFESGTGLAAFLRRFFWYHVNLTQRHQLPVLPVALFQALPLDGVGEQEYTESFGPMTVIRFRYLAVGFLRLNAEEYIQNPNPLAPGLVALMTAPEDRKAWLKAEAARRIAHDDTTPAQKRLLFSCLERYLTLTETQTNQYDQLMDTPELAEARAMAVTTYEKGIEQGIERGRLETLRRMVLRLLEKRFPRLSRKSRDAVQQKSAEELETLAEKILTAKTVRELGL